MFSFAKWQQMSSCDSQNLFQFTLLSLVFSATQKEEPRVYTPSLISSLAIATWNPYFWRLHLMLELEVVACFDFLSL